MHIKIDVIKAEWERVSASVDMLHDVVYDGQIDSGFDALPKAERVAIIGLLNNAIDYRNALSEYMKWFS
jgi:hypothetical protein